MATFLSDRIKAAVSVEEAANFYGLEQNRSGFARCPIHGTDSDPSLKIYPDGRGWYCFGCGKGGDVIALVRHLYGLSYNQAIFRIDLDFSLGLVGTEPTEEDKKRIQEAKQRQSEQKQHQIEYHDMWLKQQDAAVREDWVEYDSIGDWLFQHNDWR